MATGNNFLTLINGVKTLVASISAFTGNPNEIVSTNASGVIEPDLLPVDIDTFSWAVSRNATGVTNQFLRRQNGVPTNLAPYLCPYDAEIYYVSANCQASTPNATTWDLAIQINGGGNIVLATVPGTGDTVTAAVSQNVNAGDLVAIGMINQSATVNRPSGELFLRRR